MVAASALLLSGGAAIAQAAVKGPAGSTQQALAEPGSQLSPESGPAPGQGSTTVAPAGAAFQGALVAGTAANFSAGSTKVDCSSSSTSGKVPEAPKNTNATGPVDLEISPPTFADCQVSIPGVKAGVATNSDNGTWSVGLQHDTAGPKGMLTIPKGGVVITISGLANCTVTTAPDGPVTVPVTLTPGAQGKAPQLSISSTDVPMAVTGDALCPKSEKSGGFSATYDITSPNGEITVTG